MCPNLTLLKTYKVYPRKMDFNYNIDNLFIYVYLNPFEELHKAKQYTAGNVDYCFAYNPVYIGKGTGAGYRQHQHLTAFLQNRESNKYKVDAFSKIQSQMAEAAAVGDHTKPWNWKEYQERFIIILAAFKDPKQLLRTEMELVNSIGTLHNKKGPLANKITNAYSYDNLSAGSSLDSFLR